VNSHYSAKLAFFHALGFGAASQCEALRACAALDFAPLFQSHLQRQYGSSIFFPKQLAIVML
jgi:hypothetical protein